MRSVRCGNCGAVWLSPAAQRLVDTGETCLDCAGPLRPHDDAELERLRPGADPPES